jgi:ABC-type glycerol-3-phosphate transport system substrate-binding protein
MRRARAWAILNLANHSERRRTNMAKRTLIAGLAAAALTVAACGADDDDSETTEPTTAHTLESVTACFEDAGQKVREIETSLAELPPDVDVSSQAGSADVWVADDEAGADAVVAQAEELSKLGDESLPDSEIVVSGNAVASISTASSPDYATTVEECLPPSG